MLRFRVSAQMYEPRTIAQIIVRQLAQQQPECVDVEEVKHLIEAQQRVLAEVAQPTVVSGLRPITARELRTGLDAMQEAFDWCMGVQSGPTPPPRRVRRW